MTRHGVLRAVITFVAVASLAACAVTDEARQQRREALTRRIVDDSIAYNEAYNSAISAQILVNILRAYNRQPRQYMSMSGFSHSTPDSRTTSVSVGGLPLDQLGEHWGEAALGASTERQIEPDYKVEPFSTGAYDNIALLPTSPDVFRYYWNNGWNRDVLLLLLVDRMEVTGERQPLFNSPGTIAANCGDGYDVGGCAFVRRIRDLVGTLRTATQTPRGEIAGACYPIASYNLDAAPVLIAAPRNGAPPPCPLTIAVGATHYTLHLRSLDDVIYYVGELLRADDLHPSPDGVLQARVSVVAPGTRDQMAPLFRIVEASADTERDYAATAIYAGRRYSAGAPANQFCFHPGHAEQCAGATGDRSGTVLELLIGLLAHNQSDAAVSAPSSRLIERR